MAHRKTGDLARIGANVLITDDPETLRYINGARTSYPRSDWYKGMSADPYSDHVLSTLDTNEHDRLKAQMAGGYAGKGNPYLERDVDDQVASLVDLIERKYLSSGSDLRRLDFATVAQYFTLDVITKIAYGDAFGYLAKDEDLHEYIKTTREVVPFFILCQSVPSILYFFQSRLMHALMGPKPHDKKGMGRLMGLAERTVARRYGPGKIEQPDMVDSFIRHGITQRQAASEVFVQMYVKSLVPSFCHSKAENLLPGPSVAGSDTTATAIRATFLLINSNPSVLKRLLAEIDEAIASRKVSNPITNDESKALPYLQACIKEGLRMYPPLTGLLAKWVPKGGDVIKGRFIPGGTKIGTSMFGLQRNAIYGKDTDVFYPERWLEASDERLVQMERQLEFVFGIGRWGCLGKTIAFIELNKIFFELFRRFDFSILDPARPWNSRDVSLWIQKDMYVRVARRESNTS
ncbi:MAG: hypothetical protein M1827_001021 [Pycnora praestabilis]|nr:MAG: hypothetical protein M1827_001021 [Pycnora praestabilis]